MEQDKQAINCYEIGNENAYSRNASSSKEHTEEHMDIKGLKVDCALKRAQGFGQTYSIDRSTEE